MKLTICGVEVVHLRGKMRVRMSLCGVQSITLWGWYGQSADGIGHVVTKDITIHECTNTKEETWYVFVRSSSFPTCYSTVNIRNNHCRGFNES